MDILSRRFFLNRVYSPQLVHACACSPAVRLLNLRHSQLYCTVITLCYIVKSIIYARVRTHGQNPLCRRFHFATGSECSSQRQMSHIASLIQSVPDNINPSHLRYHTNTRSRSVRHHAALTIRNNTTHSRLSVKSRPVLRARLYGQNALFLPSAYSTSAGELQTTQKNLIRQPWQRQLRFSLLPSSSHWFTND